MASQIQCHSCCHAYTTKPAHFFFLIDTKIRAEIRIPEIGVRMALGATRVSVAQLILRQGSLLVGAGLGIGLVLALATGRLIKSFLYQVQPLDIGTYAAVVLAIALIGLTASLLPTRKATSIEPMDALRED